MKAFGCVLAILGGLICVASFVLFGTAIFRATEAHEVQVFTLQPGSKLSSDLIAVDTSRFCMITVKGRVESEHVIKTTQNNEEKLSLEFNFPLSYAVYDSAGRKIQGENTAYSSNSGKLTSTGDSNLTENGGTAEITIDYEKFNPPADGKLRIEAELQPDTVYSAKLQSPELKVYDHVSKHAKSLVVGFILLAAGGIFALAGVIFFVIGLTSRK
jgi:hypothetical protein